MGSDSGCAPDPNPAEDHNGVCDAAGHLVDDQ
jgi:hypothetical protein